MRSYLRPDLSLMSLHTEAGRLTLIAPPKSLGWVANFPGYTGDATTHEAFIGECLAQGLGVICVDPKMSTRTSEMIEASRSLLRTAQPLLGTLVGIRGVSFGASLSLPWIEAPQATRRVAWVTPCSPTHLESAASKMRLAVTNDSELSEAHPLAAQVQILELSKDEVVPTTDNLFKSQSGAATRPFEAPNHFVAGEAPAASIDLARWFAEGIA